MHGKDQIVAQNKALATSSHRGKRVRSFIQNFYNEKGQIIAKLDCFMRTSKKICLVCKVVSSSLT
jgi:hypothetical protein